MKNRLFVSVVTPSYNQARFLRRTIQSVLDQGLENFEHIVMDGGSTDGSVEVLREFPHLKWVSEPDEGQTHAINKAMAKTRGEIIAWINSDDLYAPGALPALCEFFDTHPEAHLVCGNTVLVDADDEITSRQPPKLDRRRLLHPWRNGTSVFQPGTLFRREVFERCGPLNQSLRYGMDYDFFLKATELFPIHHLEQDLAYFRYYEESKTGEGWQPFREEVKKVLGRYLRERRKPVAAAWAAFRLHVNDARMWVLESIRRAQSGDAPETRRLLLKAFLRNPFSLFCYPHLCYRFRRLVGHSLYERIRRAARGPRAENPPQGADPGANS